MSGPSDAVVAEAVAAAAKPPKQKKKRKKKKAPPYKTFQVVTPASDSPVVVRPVNAFDVLLIPNHLNGGFDYGKAPGNMKYCKLVDLSQSNFESMVQKAGSSTDKAVTRELAQSVADTIRNDWGGMFLRRINPEDTNCTQWVDIGAADSMKEVSARFQSNLTRKQNIKVKTEPGIKWERPGQLKQEEPAIPQQFIVPAPVTAQAPAPPPPAAAPPQQSTVGTMMPPQPAFATTTTTGTQVSTAQSPPNTAFPPATPSLMRLGPNGTPQLPSLPGSMQVSPGIAFIQNMPATPALPKDPNMPATPAMPPLTAPAPEQQHFSPQPPENLGLSFLPGVVKTGVPPPKPPPKAKSVLSLAPAPPPPQSATATATTADQLPKRKRGRPRKGEERPPKPPKPKRPRGRPRKDGTAPRSSYYRPIKKKVHVPTERTTASIEPLPSSPDRLRGPALLSSPTGKGSKTFQFQLDEDAGIGVANEVTVASPELPPLGAAGIMTEQQVAPEQPTSEPLPSPNRVLLPKLPKTPTRRLQNLTLISPLKPSSPFPLPIPARTAEHTNKTMEQAKAYLKVKDPEWMTHYHMLAYNRINLYLNGAMSKWTAGQIRHMCRQDGRYCDINLLEWVCDQQQMYREYCAWEEAKYQEEFGPSPEELKKKAEQQQAEEQAAHAKSVEEERQKQIVQQKNDTTSDMPPLQGTTQPLQLPAATKVADEDNGESTQDNQATTDGSQREGTEQEKEADPPAKGRPKRTKKVATKRKGAPSDAKHNPQKKQKKQAAFNKPKKGAKKGNTKKSASKEATKDDAKAKPKETTNSDTKPAARKGAATGEAKKAAHKENPFSDSNPGGCKENNGAVSGPSDEQKMVSAFSKKEPLKEAHPMKESNANAGEEPKQLPAARGGPKEAGKETSGEEGNKIVPELAGQKRGESINQEKQKTAGESHSGKQVADRAEKSLHEMVEKTVESNANAYAQYEVIQKEASTKPREDTASKINHLSEELRLAEESRIEKLREVQRAKILLLDDLRLVWQPNQEPPLDAPDDWKESFYDLREYVRTRGDTAVSDGVELGVWAQLQRKKFQRSLEMITKQTPAAGGSGVNSGDPSPPTLLSQSSGPPLSRGQMAALRALGFDWDDLESSQFYVMFLKLLEFRSRLGDCLVAPPPYERLPFEDDDEDDEGGGRDISLETRTDPKLFFWVQRQRYEFVRMLKVKEAEERRAAGVDDDGLKLVQELLVQEKREKWAANRESGRSVDDGAAEDNDDCTVVCDLVQSPPPGKKPSQEDDDKRIGKSGRIVKKRGRKRKKKIRTSEHISTLTQAHIDVLNGAGFIWSTDITHKWIQQYRRLHAFYIQNGHSQVTRTNNPAKTMLNRWCSQVRQLYQRTLNGEKYGLSQEKMDLLKRVDFKFEFEETAERYPWHERLEWLRQFKEEHGHVDVPQRHPTLGHFVKRLRKEYEVCMKGEKKMNPEKRRILDELGFKWRIRNHRRKRGPNKRRTEDGEQHPKQDDDEDEEEESDEDDDEDDDEDEEDDNDGEVVNHGGHHVNFAPDAPTSSSKNARQSAPIRKAASPGSSNQCASCFSTILFPSAKCGRCSKGFCQDCFDELLHCNDQTCSSCRGPVNPTTAGWTIPCL